MVASVNVLVLGATGRTGQHLVDQARSHGHEVIALVRDPSKLPAQDGVRVVTGSPLDPAAVAGALDGADAVLVALGNRRAREAVKSTLLTEAMDAVVPAMEERGVRRLIVLSAAGVGESARLAPTMIRLGFRTLLRQIAKDKTESERRIRGSSLDW